MDPEKKLKRLKEKKFSLSILLNFKENLLQTHGTLFHEDLAPQKVKFSNSTDLSRRPTW